MAASLQNPLKTTGMSADQFSVIDRTRAPAKQGGSELSWFAPNEENPKRDANELKRREVANVVVKATA
jgi:hypothetical protein